MQSEDFGIIATIKSNPDGDWAAHLNLTSYTLQAMTLIRDTMLDIKRKEKKKNGERILS